MDTTRLKYKYVFQFLQLKYRFIFSFIFAYRNNGTYFIMNNYIKLKDILIYIVPNLCWAGDGTAALLARARNPAKFALPSLFSQRCY
jgi:hypothetical protein